MFFFSSNKTLASSFAPAFQLSLLKGDEIHKHICESEYSNLSAVLELEVQ